jgi:hypothetical protein
LLVHSDHSLAHSHNRAVEVTDQRFHCAESGGATVPALDRGRCVEPWHPCARCCESLALIVPFVCVVVYRSHVEQPTGDDHRSVSRKQHEHETFLLVVKLKEACFAGRPSLTSQIISVRLGLVYV